jgi:hypothetical protein
VRASATTITVTAATGTGAAADFFFSPKYVPSPQRFGRSTLPRDNGAGNGYLREFSGSVA